MPEEQPQQTQQPQQQVMPAQQQPQEQGGLAWNVKFLQDITIGIVVVLFIGFAGALIAVGGMIVNYEAERQATYQNLVNQISQQNQEINTITKGLEKYKILP